MPLKVRLSLLVLALVGLIVYAWFTIQSNPKRAASGEFLGLLWLASAVISLTLFITVFFRRRPRTKV